MLYSYLSSAKESLSKNASSALGFVSNHPYATGAAATGTVALTVLAAPETLVGLAAYGLYNAAIATGTTAAVTVGYNKYKSSQSQDNNNVADKEEEKAPKQKAAKSKKAAPAPKYTSENPRRSSRLNK